MTTMLDARRGSIRRTILVSVTIIATLKRHKNKRIELNEKNGEYLSNKIKKIEGKEGKRREQKQRTRNRVKKEL